MITKQEFLVLTEYEANPNLSPKDSSRKIKISMEEFVNISAALEAKGLVNGNEITDAGMKELEPYRVKRAIFIAAGMGTRMLPITINTPKPLVRVNGVRIIDTLIDACIAAEVEEIIVVRGYLGEIFDQLKYKYPNIQFVDNPYFKTYNNISSAYLVREKIGRSYIFESDIYLVNTNLIKKYQYESNYLGVPVAETPDWCFDTDDDLRITDLHKGGKNCHHMYGISYYDQQTGDLFAQKVEEVFHNMLGGKDRFWDDVLCHYYVEEANIHVRECTFDDTMEIDSFDELCEIDHNYRMRT